MNDPGLHDPIAQTSGRVEEEKREEEDFEREEEQAFLNPSRWWFASTAFPLLAGTFGPMASAFNVCALVENWRVDIPPGFGANEAHGINVPDPKWLLGINGISLGFALISNFSLLLNMAQRLSFSIAQPITIIGWYLSSFLLVADISSIIHIVKVADERRALTQAYYYAIYAAALYFIIATLMVITVYGAWKGHYSKEFKLTMSQRTLMLQTISFMVYMVGGAGVYAKIEGWQFLDSLYFTNYTLLTVGIGDYAPNTHLGRGLLFPYAIGGILILGLVIGSIRSLVLERGKKKIGSRQIEKLREQLVSKMKKKGETDKIIPIRNQDQANDLGMSERERRREEFLLMRSIQDRVSTRQKWVSLLISAGAWLFLWLFGALIFWFCEHEQQLSYFEWLYFSYTTLLTIGFGDFKPFANSGKPFFVLWSLLAVPTLTILISNMGDTIVKGIRDLTLYLGEFTVLPGDASTSNRFRQAASQLTRLVPRAGTNHPSHTDTAGGISGEDQKTAQADSDREQQTSAMAHGADALAGDFDSRARARDAATHHHGPTLRASLHQYHYLLAREFRRVMQDLNESPPKRYTYDEWAWFLRLMGEDEDRHAGHRAPPVRPRDAEGMQNAQTDGDADADADADAAEKGQPQSKRKPWSWLGNRSPLMGEMDEAEWVMQRLSVTLEKALKRHSEGMMNTTEGAATDVYGSRGRVGPGVEEGSSSGSGSGSGSDSSEGKR